MVGSNCNQNIAVTVNVVKQYLNELIRRYSEDQLTTSATIEIFLGDPKLGYEVLTFINNHLAGRDRLIDFGCGYGILTAMFRDLLGFKEAHGVDIAEERANVARKLGINVIGVDLERDKLPYPDKYFDFAMMHGILNHLTFWDNLLQEAHRVLRNEGLLILSNPNLGWWVDRLSLLLGYQPSNVEVLKGRTCGLIPLHPRREPIGYIHSTTLRATKDLLNQFGFSVLKIWSTRVGGFALNRKVRNGLLRTLFSIADNVFGSIPGLSVRTILVAKKLGDA